MSYVPGLEGIVAAQTQISMVDGANGRLVYQGYVIADLAENMSFEEVAFLLWKGRLPSHAEQVRPIVKDGWITQAVSVEGITTVNDDGVIEDRPILWVADAS